MVGLAAVVVRAVVVAVEVAVVVATDPGCCDDVTLRLYIPAAGLICGLASKSVNIPHEFNII